ncbi:MAG: HEAT repeat domain-containing protein [Gemmatimonadaceae bacterium]|nr:HEAT repeat domain-containing protein [Gemmatimonadaceae bacterium]
MTTLALLTLLAKVTLVLGAAFVLTLALRSASAGARHLVWLIALSATVLLPVVEALSPWRLSVLPAWTAPRDVDVVPSGDVAGSPSDAPGVWAPDAVSSIASVKGSKGSKGSESLNASAFKDSDPLDPTTPFDRTPAPAAPMPLAAMLGLLWLGGVLAIGTWLLQGWLAARRIVHRATPVTSSEWLGLMYEAADRLELADTPRLVRSNDVRMPFACSAFTPTIVLPAESAEWTADRRRAVLLHELAHVQRRDLLGHTLARVVCALYWFHPVVWIAAGRMRAESEHACDDLAVRLGATPSDYAEHLLDIVTAVRRDTTPSVAIAMARRSEFEGRMLAILDPHRPRQGATRRQAITTLLLLGTVTAVVGAAEPARPGASRVADSITAGASGDPTSVVSDVDAATAIADTGRRGRRPTAPRPAPEPDVPNTPWPDPAPPTAPWPAPSPSPSPAPAPAAWPMPAVAPVDPIAPMDAPDAERVARRWSQPPLAPTAPMSMEFATPMAERLSETAAIDASRMVRRFLGGRDTLDRAARAERTRLLAQLVRTDSSASVRRIAAWGLRDDVDREGAPRDALLAAVRGDASATVREMAAWALADADNTPEVRAGLIAALAREQDSKVRKTLAWTVGQVGVREAADALLPLLSDANSATRVRAAWSLGRIDLERAPAALHARLNDPDREVRRAAAWAIKRIGDAASVEPLRSAIRTESDSTLRLTYLRVLASLGESSVAAVRALLESGDTALREEAIRVLVGRGSPSPWPWPWPDPRPFP